MYYCKTSFSLQIVCYLTDLNQCLILVTIAFFTFKENQKLVKARYSYKWVELPSNKEECFKPCPYLFTFYSKIPINTYFDCEKH